MLSDVIHHLDHSCAVSFRFQGISTIPVIWEHYLINFTKVVILINYLRGAP
jgi:hypothetical protein